MGTLSTNTMKFIPKPPKLIGPSAANAPHTVKQRILDNCIECECCGQMTHYKAAKRRYTAVQINVAGRAMSVRKAAWMAFFPNKPIREGKRITSLCENQHCINPLMLIQVDAGKVLELQYTHGVRSKAAATALLAKHTNRKYSDAIIKAIRNDSRKGQEAAKEYGINKDYYNSIQRGAARAPKSANPFAGLMR